jgi:coenzyme F420-0:L-glutamate ligase / coenzyme F420-1:gamma-L-glutamate ligase
MELTEALRGRRSIRAFSETPLPAETLEDLCQAGLLAPAPHHTRPWRFVIVSPGPSRGRLAQSMAEAWRADMLADGISEQPIKRRLAESRRRIVSAPGLILCGLVGEGLRAWPDERRRTFEWQMAAHSMGAALQNTMLAAHDKGIASYWISAPLFAPEAVRSALGLDPAFVPQALIALGYAAESYRPQPRPSSEPSEFISRA